MYKNRMGLSLIEVMIAMGVLSIAALASASLLHSGQRGLRALDGGTQHLSSVSMLQLYFMNAQPDRCANAIKAGVTANALGPAVFLPQPPVGSPTPAPPPMIRQIASDNIVLASVDASGGASRFSSIVLEELFQSLRARVDLDPTDADPTDNATVYVGQLAFRAERTGDFLGGRQLPDYAVPLRFTVRDSDNFVVRCEISAPSLGTTTTVTVNQVQIERETCENAFGGVYDETRTPRCLMSSLVLAADHAAREAVIAGLPAHLVTSTGAPAPGVVVGGELFAQNLSASNEISGNILRANQSLTTAVNANIVLRGTTRIQGTNEFVGTNQLNGASYANNVAICRQNGEGCPVLPTPIPTPTQAPPSPTPSPSVALASALYTIPRLEPYTYTVPAGASGQIRVDVIGAGGSGGCGKCRNGEGGKRGQKISQTITVTGPATYIIEVGESKTCTAAEGSGNPGLTGGSSSFGSIVAAGGAGGLKEVPGVSGCNTCYPHINGSGEVGPEDLLGLRAAVCACNSGNYPANQGGYNAQGFKNGCPTNIPGAGGGGGGDNKQGGRGGHGLVRVTPL
jgi:hypothetical protein